MKESGPMAISEREKCYHLLKEFKTAMLITHTPAGKLRARPMAIARVDESCDLWFITGQSSGKVDEIAFDRQVHVTLQEDRDRYLSLSGKARLVNDRRLVGELWREPFKVWFPGGKDDPEIVLIHVKAEEAEFWDNAGFNKLEYAAKAAKAYVTGNTPEIDRNDEYGSVTF
jgi:general stress protein 26